LIWILYPIAWGVCEGGNVIPPDSEAIFYGILDLLSKPVFGALLLWGHRNIDPSRLGLKLIDYTGDDMAVSQHKLNELLRGVLTVLLEGQWQWSPSRQWLRAEA
jgi:bacteriorhodopsin